MSRARRERLYRAVVKMTARYGEAERAFGRYPLDSPEGRKAGRAASRQFRAVVRLTRLLLDEEGTR
ncbi:hypothetical protein JNW88_29750 [Micromonospora sp. ATA32]|nr:hypothetical protein [Micromonospora sp. ATA32]